MYPVAKPYDLLEAIYFDVGAALISVFGCAVFVLMTGLESIAADPKAILLLKAATVFFAALATFLLARTMRNTMKLIRLPLFVTSSHLSRRPEAKADTEPSLDRIGCGAATEVAG